jgi:ribonuclease Z
MEPIDIYGPEGTRDLVRAMIQLTYSRVVPPYRVHELKNVPFLHFRSYQPPIPMVKTRMDPRFGEEEGGRDIYPDENGHYHLFQEGELRVQAAPMQHTVPCVGYVVAEKARSGRLKVDECKSVLERNRVALRQQGVKDPNKILALLKALKEGEEYTFPDGTVLRADDVVDPPRNGRKVVVMGDTCTGKHMEALAQDASVVVHEATNAWLSEQDKAKFETYKNLERDTIRHGHSTPQMAGLFAKRVGAKRLVLTHFSPRYRGDDMDHSMKTMWRIEDMARRAAGGMWGRNDVIAAWDQMSIPVRAEEAEGGDGGKGGRSEAYV